MLGFRKVSDDAHTPMQKGTAALQLVIDRLCQLPHCTTISLEYDRENERAAHFYSRAGFREEAGSLTGGQMARLHLTE